MHFAAGNFQDAATSYRLLAGFRPSEPFYRIRETQVRYRLGEYAETVAAGKSALLVLIGNAFNKLAQKDSASTYYRKALQHQYAYAYHRKEEFALAIPH